MAESDVTLNAGVGGAQVRTLQVTTIINGVATAVQMEVVAIADQNGNYINFAQESTAQQIISTLQAIQQNMQDLAEVIDQEITQLQAKINPVVVPAPAVNVAAPPPLPSPLLMVPEDLPNDPQFTAQKLEETNMLLRAIVYLLCDIQNTNFEDALAIAAQRGSVLQLPA